MIYLLDTNTVSELRKPRPDARCVARVNRRKLDCGLSMVTLAELGYGVERLPEGKRKEQHRRDLAYLVEDYRGASSTLTARLPRSGRVTPQSWKPNSARTGGGPLISATRRLPPPHGNTV
jgi:predicted nucleic acid-binding protein